MKRLTKERALELLREVVKGEEDYRYAMPMGRCVYKHKGAPSCLVGYVLHQHGYSLRTLGHLDALQESAFSLCHVLASVDEDAALLLGHAQSSQDSGATWGDALVNALSYA